MRGCAARVVAERLGEPPSGPVTSERRAPDPSAFPKAWDGPRVAAMVTALVFVRTTIDAVNDVAEAIAAIDGVSEVYSVTGDLDLVALVRVRVLDDVSAVVTDGIAKVPGIASTETHIAFRTYSRHDLETAFAIGLD